MINGASWRHEQNTRVAVTAAWCSANFARKKRLPKLKDVLPESKGAARKRKWEARTLEEQVFAVQALQAACGGELIYGGGNRSTSG